MQQLSKKAKRGRLLKVIGVSCALGILILWWVFPTKLEEYASFVRSDGQYRVVVLRQRSWMARMPGQSGDAAGVVRLYHKSGELLHEAPVDMVQQVDQVVWENKHVSVKLIAEWELPE